MKKALLIISIILCSAKLYSAEPVLKFIYIDGTSKNYKIADIQNIHFFAPKESYVMFVFLKDINVYVKKGITSSDTITFENDSISFGKYPNDQFKISDIDSILIQPAFCNDIKIGNQIWMCHNLNVNHYRNGDSIPEVRDSAQWVNIKTGAWCYYNNDPINGITYGKLYNWYAVNDPRGLAPDAYHVPTEADWWLLTNFLGADLIAGGRMKMIGYNYWASPNTGATNESLFSALPGGNRNSGGGFSSVGGNGDWWSSIEDGTLYAWGRSLYANGASIGRNYASKVCGFSVRCIKDK